MSETNDMRQEFEAWCEEFSSATLLDKKNRWGKLAAWAGWQAATVSKDAEIATLHKALREVTAVALPALDAALASVTMRQESYNICMSRSLSLHRDGKYAEANEASKCASAVKYATIDMAQKVGT